jgi:hypothetical protein
MVALGLVEVAVGVVSVGIGMGAHDVKSQVAITAQ